MGGSGHAKRNQMLVALLEKSHIDRLTACHEYLKPSIQSAEKKIRYP